MNDSILQDIRKLLGGSTTDNTYFDTDIILHANTFLANLVQMGVGTKGFLLTNDTQTWADFLGDSYPAAYLPQVKSYVYMRVKLIFDPPASSIAVDALEKACKELEWRLNVEVDPGMDNLNT